MASVERQNLIHRPASLSSNSDEIEIDDSAADIMASVREQEQQFALLTQEIENERRTVAKQLNHDQNNDMDYSDDMEGGSNYNSPQGDYVTETVSRREDYSDPREETEVLIDENGVSKTVTKRVVTKTVTERKVKQVKDQGSLPRNHSETRNGVNRHDQYGSLPRSYGSPDDESRGLLDRRSSQSSSGSDRDRQPVGYYAPPRPANNPQRHVQPEKFQPEDYGLEDDRRSEYSDEGDKYGLEPSSTTYPRQERRSSSQSDESDTQRYSEQLDDLPITSPRGDVARAPLATQEAGSRASLDRLGDVDGPSWKTPSLPEVIKMLYYNMPVVQQNAAAYLQHLCYNNDSVKADVGKLGGIPALIKLLDNGSPKVEQNACGALRNLCFGSRNDPNKIEAKNHEGVPAVIRLIRSTKDTDTKEQATGTLWNLSAHPELKGQVLEMGIEPLTNLIIIPYAETISKGDSKPKEVVMQDVFTNAVGVVRNLSSADSQDNRRKLRQCDGLIFALISVLQTNRENENINNKATENSICVLRNLTYKLQDETQSWKELYTLERPRSSASSDKTETSCFGKKKKEKPPEVIEDVPPDDPDATGGELLWQPEISRLYVRLLEHAGTDGIIEAALGALLNLTSGQWKWAVYARVVVRKEKGLPIVIDRLRTENDQIVRVGAITLTNLAEDSKNKDLIGKFAMKDLVYKLPGGSEPRVGLSDLTNIALLNTLRILVEKNPGNVNHLRDAGGVEKITTINNARDSNRFQGRVVKAAGQVLEAIWANKSTRSLLRTDGWNKNHFVPTVTAQTLPRNPPASSRSPPFEEPRSSGPSSSGGRRAERNAAQEGEVEMRSPKGMTASETGAGQDGQAVDSWV